MAKDCCRSECSGKQQKALIGKAAELGCQITYSKYGNIVATGSTGRESRITAAGETGKTELYRPREYTAWYRRAQVSKCVCGECSPRDAAKAVARLFAKAGERLSPGRSASREQQALNGR